MSAAFLSYARTDRDRIDPLRRMLDRLHVTVLFDEKIPGGQPWWDTILEWIRSGDLLILAVTRNSINSSACLAEVRYALDVGRPFIGVRLDEVDLAGADEILRRVQLVDFTTADDGNSACALALAVQRARPKPLPDPLPEPPPRPTAYAKHYPKRGVRPGTRNKLAVLTGVFIVLSALAAVGSHTLFPAVPAVVGLPPNEACDRLTAVGLVCTRNDRALSPEVDVVHEQAHAPGVRLTRGSTVSITYAQTGPVPLDRYQAPLPTTTDVLTTGAEAAPQGWIRQSTLGLVYPADEEGVEGLVSVYRYQCVGPACGGQLVYRLADREVPDNASWQLQGEVFRCFHSESPPQGTRPLYRLINTDRYHARRWAIPGTAEHAAALADGFAEENDPLCYIWPSGTS